MDINDEEVSIRELGLSEGLVKFYETVYPNFNLYMKYDFVGNFYKGYARVNLNNKWNYIDTRRKLLSPNQWFDGVGNFYNGYARVKLNGKWYKIDTKGNIMTAVNEHTVTITKSDIKNMVMECVKKIMNIS